MKFWQVLILILVVLFIPGKVYLAKGMPYTHDGENHLARFANYKIAVRELQIPPRFAPNLYSGFGYPVFNYNYPLANIGSLPFSVLGISYILTFKILAISSLLILGFGSWWWLEAQSKHNLASWLASMAIMSSPYIINLTAVRGSIGELMALAITPWIGFIWLNTLKLRTAWAWWLLTFSISGLLLSHNLLGPAGLGIIWLWVLLTQKFSKTGFSNLLAGSIFGFLSSLWFWLPALGEKQLVLLDDSPISKMAATHLVTFTQLLLGKMQFGYSQTGQIDTMNLSLGIALLLGFTLALVFNLAQLAKLKVKLSFGWLIIGLLLVVLQTPVSSLVWQNIKLIQIIQFPWRLTALWLWIASWSLVYIWPKISFFAKTLIVALLLAQILVGLRVTAVDYFNRSNLELDLYSQSTSTLNENLPRSFKLDTLPSWQPMPTLIKADHAAVSIHRWQGSNRSYKLVVTKPVLVIEPTMNFLGWQTMVNNQRVEYADSAEIGGRIAYIIDMPGEYEISSKFTQATWPRLIGNTFSLITMGVITIYAIVAIKLAKK